MSNSITQIKGGVCAPIGFTASGLRCGIKEGSAKPDLALIMSEYPCAAAGVFTQNRVQAEPVKLTKARVLAAAQKTGDTAPCGGDYALNFANAIRAVIANSGNANACTGKAGAENARRMTSAVAQATELNEESVLVCSTGVIGQPLNISAVEQAVPKLVKALAKNGNEAARAAIMTTDTRYKEYAAQTIIDGKTIRLGSMAKGSGMIHINMGTMLGFITTDCAISARMLDCALRESSARTYNCVSVDGDTSTNDSLLLLANGAAGNAPITEKNADYYAFVALLDAVNVYIARQIAADGEGAERLIECVVNGAQNEEAARVLAKSVVSSNLVKAAFFGCDANWGRILCAMGYSGAAFTPENASVFFESAAGTIEVYKAGVPADFDEKRAKDILSKPEVRIIVELLDGQSRGAAWGCDLTYNYVKINGDYRS